MAQTRRTGVTALLLVAFWISAAVWFLALGAFTVYVFADWVLMPPGDSLFSCRLDPSSDPSSAVYGDSYWSWSQLGEVCDFGSFERGPGLSRWAFGVGLLGWGSALLITARLLWRSRSLKRAAVRSSQFAEQAHLQSAAVAASTHEADDQAFVDAVSSDDE